MRSDTVRAAYKYDQEVLKELLSSKDLPVTKSHLHELQKVINVVWITKVQSLEYNGIKASDYKEDLMEFAKLAVLSRRGQFQEYIPILDEEGEVVTDNSGKVKTRKILPSNYIFTVCRNEMGNIFKKHFSREFLENDDSINYINAVRTKIIDTESAELPSEVAKFKNYLLGLEEFTYVRISKVDALNLTVWMKLYESSRPFELPEYLKTESKSANKIIKVLYKLLKDGFK